MSAVGSSALCDVCGCARTVKVTRDGRYRPAGFDPLDATCDLRCRGCRAVTRHALCFAAEDPVPGRAKESGADRTSWRSERKQWHEDVERGLLDARTWILTGARSMWRRGFAAGASGRPGYVAGVYAGLVAAHDYARAESWRAGATEGEKGDAESWRA